MRRKILFEVIVASLDDALAAAEGGADRFELCSALALGGLTPSMGTLRLIREHTTAPLMAMIRPREGGMAYSRREFMTMLEDVELCVENGADGIVFGFLDDEGRIQIDRCRELLSRIQRTGRKVQTTFHRAFDAVRDPGQALDQLIDLGVTRVLTSGREAFALEGIEEIRRMVERAGGRIKILPGGGIDEDNVAEIVRRTGVEEVHLYLTEVRQDMSVAGNDKIFFGAHLPKNEREVRRVDPSRVARVRQLLGAVHGDTAAGPP